MDLQLTIGDAVWPAIDIRWNTHRVGKPAELCADLPKVDAAPAMGEAISLACDGSILFRGYVFEASHTAERRRIVAYDQLRYLMFKDSYIFEQQTADAIIALIANDMGLACGSLAPTGFPLDFVIEDKKLIDIIDQALQMTFDQTGVRYTLYDDAGKLTLVERGSLDSGLLVGPDSLLTGYTQAVSIDRDTFNRIKLAQKDRKKGLRTIVVESDSASANTWGTLQYYDRVDEKLTTAQIQSQARQILAEKNRPTHSLTITAVGHTALRAGVNLAAQLDGEPDMFVIERACHVWSGPRYDMTLDLLALS